MQVLVAVENATIFYDSLYSYLVPVPLKERVFAGSIVLIPFGKGKTRPRVGVVIRMDDSIQTEKSLKEVLDAAPKEAALSGEMIRMVEYLKDTAFCSWHEAVRAVLPLGAQYEACEDGSKWVLRTKLQPAKVRVFKLEKPSYGNGKMTAKQQKIAVYLEKGPAKKSDILANCDVSASVLRTMEENGMIKSFREETKEERVSDNTRQHFLPVLSASQQQVADSLLLMMKQNRPKPVVFYGVTGSGKTPVFIHLVEEALQKKKGALILVPEIGLISQMVQQCLDAFGNQVAVLHSGLSSARRLFQWNRVQTGSAKVVIGTRSAVFAPLPSIGVIIVDEEQEYTYHGENAPRYHAVDLLRRRAAFHNTLLVLASATPSVSDYFLAKSGNFSLVKLHERYGNLPLPAVEMVDMRGAYEAEYTESLGKKLLEEIEKTIARKEQAIILLNRRGYQRVGVCRSCGKAIQCGDCSVPLVYHKAQERLLCHYCARVMAPVPYLCPSCGGEIRYTGFGTQHAQEELERRLPNARILRMDQDTTRKKDAHKQMLASFARGEYDVLLGTQMVAKGLDFDLVSLVGVVGIDSLLFRQGYRAMETVFALVTQVVGRAGRKGKQGKALIQTLDPDHPVLQLASRQNYEAFYEEEIVFRKLALYPPFCTFCTVGFLSKVEADAWNAATSFAHILIDIAKSKPNVPLRVLGPAPMQVAQVAGNYRFRLTLKCKAGEEFRALAWKTLEEYNKRGWSRKASLFLDFFDQDI